ncbi:MAG: response regulator, partial [Treponema sp.]|nr:response regulator [Treponema sp.]
FSKDDFVKEFISETGENLDTINDSIIKLKNDDGDKDNLTVILRCLHTIKGTARMLSYPTIEKISHGLEDVYKGLREGKYRLSDRIVQLTFRTCDIIKGCLQRILMDEDDGVDTDALMDVYAKASEGLFFSLEDLDSGVTELVQDEPQEDLGSITSIRIPIEKINAILKSVDDIITKQFSFKKQLDDLCQQRPDMRMADFPNQMKEDVLRIEQSVLAAQHQILDLRLLPLDIILTPLKRQIESEAIKSGKGIKLDIPPASFMLDKFILERLRDILLHLVRNSIDHGIESREERAAAGKDETGQISVIARQMSNHLLIQVSDDGRGINWEKIREKAMRLYPLDAESIKKESENELQQYLYAPGFSTLSTPTLLSGRGMGLDIVRSSVESIKGRIRLTSKKNEGTTFELTIPLTVATQEGLFIRSGDMKFMLPAEYVLELVDNENVPKTMIQDQTFIKLGDRLIPVYNLSSILGSGKSAPSFHIVVVEYLESCIGIMVDSVDQYENLVMSPLPKIMQSMRSLRGIVFDENYSIIPVLNIPDIIQRLKKLVAYDLKKSRVKGMKKTYSVLVVDDSSTTREIEAAIFESSGYAVETAVDGVDALNKLNEKHIDAVITDIAMPRMDGIMLLSNIRRQEQYNGMPVIVVSGAYDPEARKQFLDAGAQAFIVKSDFQRGNLLQAVEELLNVR